ncbi:hypothetical protein HZB00_03795 [Candidatus Woesearchaeota archaeon]|nr:hypothetical protein [Candidatus Woesearchaeota archaeon]
MNSTERDLLEKVRFSRSVDSYLFSIQRETHPLEDMEYHLLRAAMIALMLQKEAGLTLENIISRFAEKAGVAEEILTDPDYKRKDTNAAARMGIRHLYREAGLSYQDIGEKIKRDHATVIYGERKIEETLKTRAGLIERAFASPEEYVEEGEVELPFFCEEQHRVLVHALIHGELALHRPNILPNNLLKYVGGKMGYNERKIRWHEVRGKSLVAVRKSLYFLFREHFRLSFPIIGRIMDRGHSSVLNGHYNTKMVYGRYADIIDKVVAERVHHAGYEQLWLLK